VDQLSKKWLCLLGLLLIVTALTGCSGDDTTPQEKLDSYVKLWNKQEFPKMYPMLAKESAKKYKEKDFAGRYAKIYQDLEISKLKVTYEVPDQDVLKKQEKQKKATFPIQVNMQSIAGPIEFKSTATLLKEENKDGDENWYVDWDPGLIFPDLADGGSLEVQTEEPQRGEILDRNQMPLAINDVAYRFGIVPEQFGEDKAKKERLASLLGMKTGEIDDALSASWVKPNLFVPLKTLPKTAESAVYELTQMNGVTYTEASSRVYPLGKAASHLIGYVGKITAEELKDKGAAYSANDLIGKRGLEQLYEDQLRGKAGTRILVKQQDGEESLLAEKPKQDGENIKLTIDVNLQEKIYKSYGSDAGTSAAVDPASGQTLALVSSPGFDPALFVNGISQSSLEALENDPQKPLINRFSLTFAPGSSIKPISAAIGLDNGTIKPNEGIKINGLTWGKSGWGGYQVKRVSGTDKPVDVTDALVRSDNIFFAKKGVEMGTEKYESGLKKFGFGEKIPFAYPIKKSQISNSGTFDSELLMANSIYGQGELQASSLHMALTYGPILNEGKMMKPTLLLSEEKGEVWHDGLISKSDADVLQKALRKVVTNGTAKAAKDAKIEISGKTGTAELKASQKVKGHENNWFVAYPTKKKDIVLAMMVEKTEGRGQIVIKRVADILSSKK